MLEFFRTRCLSILRSVYLAIYEYRTYILKSRGTYIDEFKYLIVHIINSFIKKTANNRETIRSTNKNALIIAFFKYGFYSKLDGFSLLILKLNFAYIEPKKIILKCQSSKYN